jgi:hypothetical protein
LGGLVLLDVGCAGLNATLLPHAGLKLNPSRDTGVL